MVFPRSILPNLLEWKNDPGHKPLILRGARQVGKTHLVETFAKAQFKNVVSLNFERHQHLEPIFSSGLPITELIAKLEVVTQTRITAGETLIFFDEIQACAPAIASLRYFYEELPQLHVIAAGSLLEFALDQADTAFPVGRVTMRYLHPFSYLEFLWAVGEDALANYLRQVPLTENILDPLHQKARNLLRNYLLLGGMPEVVSRYYESQSFIKADSHKEDLLKTFQDDFRKYGRKVNVHHLEIVFKMAAEHIGQRVQFSHVEGVASSQAIAASRLLEKAMLIRRVPRLQAVSFPMLPKRKASPKLLFLDVGLAQHLNRISQQIIESDNISAIYKGGLAEQYVGQTLLALLGTCSAPELFFWQRDHGPAQAEVDYVYPYQSYLLPIEVKFGRGSTLASLHQFVSAHQPPLALRIYDGMLSIEPVKARLPQGGFVDYRMLSVPLYLCHELPRLIKQALDS